MGFGEEGNTGALAERLLACLPAAVAWTRASTQQHVAGHPAGHSFTATSPCRTPPRALEVNVRHDGDADVCFSLDGVPASPFEQHFVVRDAPVEDAAAAIAEFVADLVAERRVLVMDNGFLRGGRLFLTPQQLEECSPRRVAWVASWNGTYDRDLKVKT